MNSPLRHCADDAEGLLQSAQRLAAKAANLGLAPLEGREWFELLLRRLVPQLGGSAPLIVAIVGGTNTGKSMVFNHIAGQQASSVTPFAAGTRHPVALAPSSINPGELESIFEGFTLRSWSNPDEALGDDEEHRLYWRTSDSLPENLIVLDTPDIDSDARVNWKRAEMVRQSADVLFAVLTMQKYNDVAIKDFFRMAGKEDIAVVVVFNMLHPAHYEKVWRVWLETFVEGTGVVPEWVYLAPDDLDAVDANRLEFLERNWPVADSDEPLDAAHDAPHDLALDLSRLKFDEIKLRSLRGALRKVLDPDAGVPSWLDEIDRTSGQFRAARDELASNPHGGPWPNMPAGLLIDAVRSWWRGQRNSDWSGRLHAASDRLNRAVSWPLRMIRDRWRRGAVDPVTRYRRLEWDAIVRKLDLVYEQLERLRDMDHQHLTPRLSPILEGSARHHATEAIKAEFNDTDVGEELLKFVDGKMQLFRKENPKTFRCLRWIDKAAAVARPVTIVALASTGVGPVGGETVAQFAINAAGEVVLRSLGGAVGEATISSSAATGLAFIEARFRQLQSGFALHRCDWLRQRIETLVFGDLLPEIHDLAELPDSTAFGDVCRAIDALSARVSPEISQLISEAS